MNRSIIRNITLYNEDLVIIDKAKKDNHKFNFSEFVRFCLADKQNIENYQKTL